MKKMSIWASFIYVILWFLVYIHVFLYMIMLKTTLFWRWCWIPVMIRITFFASSSLLRPCHSKGHKVLCMFCSLSGSGKQLKHLCYTYAIFSKDYLAISMPSKFVPVLVYLLHNIHVIENGGKLTHTDHQKTIIRLILHFKMPEK